MNEKDFKVIKRYLGIELIKYVLDKDEISENQYFLDLELRDSQYRVLEDVYELIKKTIKSHNENGSFGEGIELSLSDYHIANVSIFRVFHKRSGGNDYIPESDDHILAHLFKLARNNYGSLLLRPQIDCIHQNRIFHFEDFKPFFFVELILNDELKELTNGEDGPDCFLDVNLSWPMNLAQSCSVLDSEIVKRAFSNCCNNMSYSLDSLYIEIEKLVHSLRELAKKGKSSFKQYYGLGHLWLESNKTYEFKDCSLKPINTFYNPMFLKWGMSSTFQDSEGNKKISGAMLCIINDIELQSADFELSHEHLIKIRDKERKIVRAVKLAAVLASKSKGIPENLYSESGFPLEIIGNYSKGKRSIQGIIKISSDNFKEFEDWISILVDKNYKNLDVVLSRLEESFKLKNPPEDSIVDAIIAWEGMFSGVSETRFKVTASIAKLLEEDYLKRRDFVKRLKKLYDLRSKIVHGSSRIIFPDAAEGKKVRDEALEIGLDCLKRILKDDDLLKMSANERVNHILLS